MKKNGFLLINLGTPASPSTADVRAYLNEFLMDPYVIDTPWPVRRALVSLFILPFRPRRSAEAYASIWDPETGSPLLHHCQQLTQALSEILPGPAALAMRYGEPSIAAGVAQLKAQQIDELIVIPLYPQYADSTITTSIEAVRNCVGDTPMQVLAPYYDAPEFINSLAADIRPFLHSGENQQTGDAPTASHLLLSYHGLPERHLQRTDPTGSHCLASEDCCQRSSPAHATCYRHQVFATSKALATQLGLSPDQYTVSFQSRLGRLPWLQPFTDQVLAELPGRGIKNLAVACPAFVADNLETLEEIGMQGYETFTAAGGEHLQLIPCLNSTPTWVRGLADIIERGHTL